MKSTVFLILLLVFAIAAVALTLSLSKGLQEKETSATDKRLLSDASGRDGGGGAKSQEPEIPVVYEQDKPSEVVYEINNEKPTPKLSGEDLKKFRGNTEYVKDYGGAPDFEHPTAFVNSEPFNLKEYVGKKLILVNFWTFGCYNSQNVLPYFNSWHEKYSNQGLLIVGVHSPEFGYEKDLENVKDAVRRYDIKYPVVLDNDFGTWDAYGNNYWPSRYLIGYDGKIVYRYFGEGAYDQTEQVIKSLLEAHAGKEYQN